MDWCRWRRYGHGKEAHVLDVNVDRVGRRQRREYAGTGVPRCDIDADAGLRNGEKMEAGLKVAGGKCLLNSTGTMKMGNWF